MSLVPISQVSLLTGKNSTTHQTAMATSTAGGASTFLQALDNIASEPGSQTDSDGLVNHKSAMLETAVLALGGASMKPSHPINDASKESAVAPVADAVWLANWFQNHSPTAASSPPPLLVTASGPDEPARLEIAPQPLVMFSTGSISRADPPISDKTQQNPWILSGQPVNAGAQLPAAASSRVAASLLMQTSSAIQAISEPPLPPTPKGAGLLDNKSSNNLPLASSHLSPAEVLSTVPMAMGASVKWGQSVGFKDTQDFENGRWLPLMPVSGQVRLEPQVAQNPAHPLVGKEAAPPGLSPDAQSTLNLVEPALLVTSPERLTTVFSEPISRTDVPISDKPQHSQWVLPDKPVNAGATSIAATPSIAAVSSLQPASTLVQATFQPASIGVVILDKKTLKNQFTDSDNFRSTDVLSKVSMDMEGSVKLGPSVGFKDIQDIENDRWLPVTPGSGQVSSDPHASLNLPHQTVGAEAETPRLSQDAQWTSNLADTVNQWVERSLQLAELTVPDAGLDSLQVRIELNGQEAKVYFLTDHVQYRDAIESQIENLSDRLADQGLKLTGSFVGQGGSQNSPQEPSAHSMLSRRPEIEPASPTPKSIDPVLRAKSVLQGRVLDVFA